MLNKIRTIFLSRVKTVKKEDWEVKRTKICLECEHNTLNGGILKGYIFFLTTLSVFYSWIMGRLKDEGSLGYCNLCGCDNFFKISEKEERCVANKWETLEDNSVRLNIRKQRKDASKKNNR